MVNSYNQAVTYSEGVTITYPDFTLTYTGKTHKKSEHFKHGFTYYNFVVESPSGKQEISWSSGTGEITETDFIVNGKKFYLDLAPRKNGKFINSGKDDLIIHDEEGYKSYTSQ